MRIKTTLSPLFLMPLRDVYAFKATKAISMSKAPVTFHQLEQSNAPDLGRHNCHGRGTAFGGAWLSAVRSLERSLENELAQMEDGADSAEIG